MRLTARDRKILLVIGVLVVPLAYWFLLLSPKRDEQSTVQNQLTQARSAEQTAAERLANLTQAKRSFASDYTTVITLGKSIPSTLDMSSLLTQLDAAAGGNRVIFTSVTSGAHSSQPGAASAGTTTTGASQSSSKPTSSLPGLDSVPISFEFDGTFFDLANFFHNVKRFVQVVNGQVVVTGRLITIDNVEFKVPPVAGSAGSGGSPTVSATVSATVYLAPESQGVTAGATPSGPAGTSSAAAPVSGSSSASSAPSAAVVAR